VGPDHGVPRRGLPGAAGAQRVPGKGLAVHAGFALQIARVRRILVVVAVRRFSDGGTCLQRSGIRFGGSFLAAHGGMPLVGVKVIPPRRCATSGALLSRGTRMAAVSEDARLWSGSSEPSATEPAWRADQGEAHFLRPPMTKSSGKPTLACRPRGPIQIE
jgi:hypothetical protein